MNIQGRIDNFNLYYEENHNYSLLARKIIKNHYTLLKTLQNRDNREVKLIEVDGTKYVLKKEKGRGILDRFIHSRGRTTLENVLLLRAKGFKELYDVKLAMERKKGLGISSTYFLSEYIEGTQITPEDYDDVMKLLAQLHKLGHFHGDAKPKNFIKTSHGIVLIDSRLRSAKISWLGKCKDVVRFQRRCGVKLDLNKYFKGYRKHLSYYIAILLVYKKEIIKNYHSLKDVLR